MNDLFKPMTLEDKYFNDQITFKINNPMKMFRIEFYKFNKTTGTMQWHSRVLDAKGLAEFIIMTAYDKEYMIREVKEL